MVFNQRFSVQILKYMFSVQKPTVSVFSLSGKKVSEFSTFFLLCCVVYICIGLEIRTPQIFGSKELKSPKRSGFLTVNKSSELEGNFDQDRAGRS